MFPVTSADFDQNYQPINDTYPGLTPGSYVTRAGDNLQSIALGMWGDSSLWYLLADANGLKGTEQIAAGTRLTIPNVVTNIHNNSQTFRPYDPGLALGDTTPTLPDPPPPPRKKKSCGGLGQILQRHRPQARAEGDQQPAADFDRLHRPLGLRIGLLVAHR